MNCTSHSMAGWFRVAILVAALALIGDPQPAQSQGKSPVKPPTQASSQPKDDPLGPLLQRAKEAIDKNDFSAALEPLQKYIAERPDDPYAHFQLGYANAGLKHWEEAKAEFSRAIALDPKMGPAYLNLGLVLMDSDPGGAAEAFRSAADLQPTESRPRFLSGLALERAGKFTEAIEQYRAALVISPKDYECHFALGRALLRSNDAPGAEEHFHEAIGARGDSAPAHLGLANALLAQKKFEAGSDALAEYLKLKPDDRAEHFERASALMEIDRFEDALAELDHAETGAAPTSDGLKMRGDIYLRQKKWKEASETLARAIQQSPQDQQLLEWLGQAEIELHDFPAAINVLGKVVANDPQDADALRDLVNAFFLNADYAATIGAMDRLAKLETPKPASWFVRAICYDKLSRKAEAIEAYQKFLELDNGQNETRDFQARRRAYTLQSELAQLPKRPKH
jgi:tetratricopeptide (TPR) repeat protein